MLLQAKQSQHNKQNKSLTTPTTADKPIQNPYKMTKKANDTTTRDDFDCDLTQAGNSAKDYKLNDNIDDPKKINKLTGKRPPAKGTNNYDEFFECLDLDKVCTIKKAAIVQNFYFAHGKLDIMPPRLKTFIEDNNIRLIQQTGQETISSWGCFFRGTRQPQRYKQTWESLPENKGKKFDDAVATLNNAWKPFVNNEMLQRSKPKKQSSKSKQKQNKITKTKAPADTKTSNASDNAQVQVKNVPTNANTTTEKKAPAANETSNASDNTQVTVRNAPHDTKTTTRTTRASQKRQPEASPTKDNLDKKGENVSTKKSKHSHNMATNNNRPTKPAPVSTPSKNNNNNDSSSKEKTSKRGIFEEENEADAQAKQDNHIEKQQRVRDLKHMGVSDNMILQMLPQWYPDLQPAALFYNQIVQMGFKRDEIIALFKDAYGGLNPPANLATTHQTPTKTSNKSTTVKVEHDDKHKEDEDEHQEEEEEDDNDIDGDKIDEDDDSDSGYHSSNSSTTVPLHE
jgi:hypothetical protein